MDLFRICITAKGLEFIDLIYRPEGKRLILTVLADKPLGGITLQECAGLSRQLKNLLEEKNIIDGDYILEVSSPGLDRPLKRPKDFLRCLNKEAVFFLNDLVGGKCQWQGEINRVDGSVVFIRTGEQTLEIPLIKINKAQLVI
ncbi:MAG: ribosome maturation factor RimP [Candidatus Omnitrophota bacterium]